MKILAIDGSTKATGVAYYIDDKLQEYQLITASSNDLIKRIQKIIGGLASFIADHDVDLVILEEVTPDPYQKNPQKNLKTYRALMFLQAAINFLLHEVKPKAKIDYIYPSEWRSACGISTGRGIKRESLKIADIEFVNKQFNLNIESDDIADAIGIGWGYILKNSVIDTGEDMNWG